MLSLYPFDTLTRHVQISGIKRIGQHASCTRTIKYMCMRIRFALYCMQSHVSIELRKLAQIFTNIVIVQHKPLLDNIRIFTIKHKNLSVTCLADVLVAKWRSVAPISLEQPNTLTIHRAFFVHDAEVFRHHHADLEIELGLVRLVDTSINYEQRLYLVDCFLRLDHKL